MAQHLAIIDNSPAIRFLYTSILVGEHYALSLYDESPTTALRIRQRYPDLIIYGNISGSTDEEWRFIDRLRSWAALAHTPILLTTTGYELVRDCIEHGKRTNVCLLRKPFTRPELLDAVRMALEPSMGRMPALPEQPARSARSESLQPGA